MVGIVRIALQRPYTFVVLALLILIIGTAGARCARPTDIFPEHQHSDRRARLAVHRPAARPDGRPHHDASRSAR